MAKLSREHQIFGDELQKQMDKDYEDLIQAEQKTGRKLEPAYMGEDYFQSKKDRR